MKNVKLLILISVLLSLILSMTYSFSQEKTEPRTRKVIFKDETKSELEQLIRRLDALEQRVEKLEKLKNN